MQDAYDSVAQLEHQTRMAESTYWQMRLAADSIGTYAWNLRCELERASRKLQEYQSIVSNSPLAAHLPPFYAHGDIQQLDPHYLSGELLLAFEQ